jgi:hypothetical protein
VLIAWWLWQVRGTGLAENWTPFATYNIGTVVVQWAVVIAVLIGINRFLVTRSLGRAEET